MMKPAFEPNARLKDRIARWISFLALVALLAMATVPLEPAQREIASDNTKHRSETWHG